MIKQLKKGLAFLVVVSLCLIGIPSNVKAASYPVLFFFGDENYEDSVVKDEVLQGETYIIRMKWYAVYNNEGYDIVITDSNGIAVAETSKQFTNSSLVSKIAVSWDTEDVPAGDYTVTVTKQFYSFYRWNEAPTKSHLYLSVVSPCDKNGHTYDNWKTTKKATVSASGRKQRECTVCGKTETKTIPRLKPTLKLSKTKATIKKGRSLKIKVSKLANGDKVVSWKTSNKKIATVKNGIIKAIKKGRAVITVKLKSGKKATVKITVK